jgi:hypothetical protein
VDEQSSAATSRGCGMASCSADFLFLTVEMRRIKHQGIFSYPSMFIIKGAGQQSPVGIGY